MKAKAEMLPGGHGADTPAGAGVTSPPSGGHRQSTRTQAHSRRTDFADDLPLDRRDLIAAIGIVGMDVSDAMKEYEKRGIIVCDRSNRSMYARRIVEALGTTGAIRVSPLHCHGVEDIDRFLEITKHLTQIART